MWSGEDAGYDYPGDFDSTEEDVQVLREAKSLTNTVIVKLEPKNIVNLNLRVGHEVFEVAGEQHGNKNQKVKNIMDEIATGSRKMMESTEHPSLKADVSTEDFAKERMDANMKEEMMGVNMKEAGQEIVQGDIPSILKESLKDVMKDRDEPEDNTVTIVIVLVVGVLIIGIIIIAIYLWKRLVTVFVIKKTWKFNSKKKVKGGF